MIKREQVWTGTINENVPQMDARSRVQFYDTTLRDGEQSVGVVINSAQKLEIAKLIDGLGVPRIEAGFPRVSDDDRLAIQLILEAGLNAEVWGFSRAVQADVEAIVGLGLESTIIEAPISDSKLKALSVDRSEMLARIDRAVSYAASRGVRVAFFGVDGSRANEDFYREAYRVAAQAGASEAVAVDTMGIAAPEAAAHLVKVTVEAVGPTIPVHFHGHNDFGLATAGAVAAVRAGASWIHGTMNGMGERAGNANIPEVALALEALYNVETGVDFSNVTHISKRIQALCGYMLEPWKPLVGQNLFRRETGTVASQFHIPQAIEPYSSTLVGQDRSIVLGKKSGLDSIRIKCTDLGLDVASELYPRLLEVVKQRSIENRGLVSDDQFKELVTKTQAES